uniref:Uncharacterized protein n=1 Tax=Geospiza parvula TaxID=87175 RepID=A0A8U8CEM0_GEOPR
MSLSHTTGEEHSGGLCPSSCKKSFLVPLQEDLAPALMAEIQMEVPFLRLPWMEVGGRARGRGSTRSVMSSLVGRYLQEHLCSPNMGEHLEPV